MPTTIFLRSLRCRIKLPPQIYRYLRLAGVSAFGQFGFIDSCSLVSLMVTTEPAACSPAWRSFLETGNQKLETPTTLISPAIYRNLPVCTALFFRKKLGLNYEDKARCPCLKCRNCS